MADDKKTLELQIRIAADEALRAASSLKGEMTGLAAEMRKLSEADGEAVKRAFRETQAAADKAAASMKLFGASSGELRQMQAQVKAAAVDLVVKGLNPQSEEVRKLTEEYKRLGKEASDLDQAAGKNINSFGDLKNALGSLAQVAALAKALAAIKDMGAFALSTADTFQTARNEFGVLLGDMEAGAGLFNQIKAFNDKTPFSLDTLTQATSVLLSAKTPLADLQNQLAKFGDLSQGNSQKFTSYINAFSKAAAKGKADMETLNVYINQGVPILDALGKRFDAATAEIVEMTSQGKIGFEDFSAALTDLTAEGGQYFGGMELGSQSLAAMQEGLKESVNSLAASFGEMLLPAAIKVVETLTAITNAINDSPVTKGVLAGALAALTGYLAAMAVKAGVAFAAQMSLNLAVWALNPVVLAATIAAAGLAAGYVKYTADLQKAEREGENFAFQQRVQKNAIDESTAALQGYSRALKDMADTDLDRNIPFIENEIAAIEASISELEGAYNRAIESGRQNMADYWADIIAREKETLERARADLLATGEESGKRRTNWIDSMFSATDVGKTQAQIQRINEQLAAAQKYLTGPGLGGSEQAKLHEIIKSLTAELEKFTNAISEADRTAAKWKEDWAGVWKQFQAEQSGDPFALVNLEEEKKKLDAFRSYIRGVDPESENAAVLAQIAEYYASKRGEIAKDLKDEEERLERELSKTRVDNLEYELQEALKSIDTLEAKRVIAAAGSEEEILAIREQYAAMRAALEENYAEQIAGALAEEAGQDPMRERLEKAKAGIVDWQQALADSLSLSLMNIEDFSGQAAVTLGELSAQLTELSVSAALGGFEEFGRALGEGEDAAESFRRALADMARQILQQLPTMFLQAGLQLIIDRQWALGLGFIAAAASSAVISGYVDGASENAQGGVYGEYGRAAREYAAGGAFTNQIVSRPTYFRYGGGLGIMGEAGPEAIMPLTRGSDGRLGVTASGAGGGTAVYVIIQNYTSEEVRTEESSDSAGNQIRKVIIGAVKQSISSGEMDQTMSGRYGLRARGV
ncbi:MAG: tape measure protein [Treponema sp.]|jgi:tape measure domain-containing protein|nr:tape measure protein [Treponema sp.]